MTADGLSIKLMQRIPVFRDLNETECRQLAEAFSTRDFAAGETVIEQGKNCQNLWVLLEGVCEVVRMPVRDKLTMPSTALASESASAARSAVSTPEEPLLLAKLEPYSHFGEMSFFHPAPHSAHVIARSPVQLLCMRRGDYDDLIQEGVTAAYKLAYNTLQGLAERLRKMDERFAELATHQECHGNHPPPAHEWNVFRERLFENWSL